jgi:gluconokinase
MVASSSVAGPPRVIVLTGVAGVGKTTIGASLARVLGWSFLDTDELHSPASVEKIRRGEPLTENDRAAWLAMVRRHIETWVTSGVCGIVACSALRESHRDLLTRGLPGVFLVHLVADLAVIRQRLEQRRGHFAGPELLESQLATRELPHRGITIDAARPVDEVVGSIRSALGL